MSFAIDIWIIEYTILLASARNIGRQCSMDVVGRYGVSAAWTYVDRIHAESPGGSWCCVRTPRAAATANNSPSSLRLITFFTGSRKITNWVEVDSLNRMLLRRR